MSLRGNRDLNIFWAVQTLSTAGHTFSMVAIPLLVLEVTGSIVQMGLVTAVAGVANITAGIFASVIADRVDRRRLLIITDLARAVLYGAIPVVWAIATPVWLIYVVVPLCAALAMLFQVTYVAVVPRLVDADQITQANGRLYASYAAAGIAGPVLAGLLSAWLGLAAAIAVDAATFLVSAIGIYFIRFRPAQDAPTAADDLPLWQNLLVGAHFLWRHPVLRAAVQGDPPPDRPGVALRAPDDTAEAVVTAVVVQVPDCRQACDRVAAGVELLTEPAKPTWGGEVRAFLRDPDGHLIEINEALG